ncbi:MAG: dihydrodipicolinate synthase family protein [Actinomycetota bacterium]|nr:dihydrodipicolinate synthase family protein [Actinomycetota bacterium]
MKTPPTTMAALITPFDAAGLIDGNAHRHNLRVLTDRGLQGFLIAGSTGQGPYLEPGERAFLTETARSELGSSAFLLAGISAQSVRQGTLQTSEAFDAGADAVLVTTPTLLLRRDHELVASFFRSVADSSPLPVFCYSVPAVTSYELPIETALELAGHPNIVGMKDSGGDPDRVAPIIAGADDGYYLYTGASRIVHEACVRGAYGAVTASANYAYTLVETARTDLDAQDRLSAVSATVERHGLAGTYAAAEMEGLSPGMLRAPLEALNAEDREEMRQLCCPGAGQ